ncbi:hypothetical protein LUX05_21020 [Streptomyces somaliensis]|nr:hypothetical protein [Streptomyces somaliensis]
MPTVPRLRAAFGGGAWHHVVFRRSGGKLSLSVDGGTPGGAPARPGSVTCEDGFAVLVRHLGARPDGIDRLKGSPDAFRLVRRALTAEKPAAPRASNTDTGTATTIRLPFETPPPAVRPDVGRVRRILPAGVRPPPTGTTRPAAGAPSPGFSWRASARRPPAGGRRRPCKPGSGGCDGRTQAAP